MKKFLVLPLLLIAIATFAQDAQEIIGNPIKIGNLLVAENDIPEDLNLDDAKKACQDFSKVRELGLQGIYDLINQYCN